MNDDIYTIDYTRTLPPALKNDEKMRSAAQAIAQELQKCTRKIRNNIIYARIEELPENILDLLAYDMHIDWYDFDYPVTVKRELIKTGIKVHRKLGTKYAVETALRALHPDSRVEEWFDYGGEPFCFRVRLDVTKSNITAEYEKIKEVIFIYKRLTAHLEQIYCVYNSKAAAKIKYMSALTFVSEFYPRFNQEPLYVDGAWQLNGEKVINGYKSDILVDFYPVTINFVLPVRNEILSDTGAIIKTDVTSERECSETAMLVNADATESIGTSGTVKLSGSVMAESSLGAALTIEKDLWYLDGGVPLDASRMLDASIIHHDL